MQKGAYGSRFRPSYFDIEGGLPFIGSRFPLFRFIITKIIHTAAPFAS
jgi:hypothetical protein